MTKNKKITEKRKDTRQQVYCFSLISDSSTGGPIIDLSMGGASFLYVNGNDQPKKHWKLGTIVSDNIFLENLPIERVVETREIIKGVSVVRCGLKFGSLTSNQKTRLKHMLLQARLRTRPAFKRVQERFK